MKRLSLCAQFVVVLFVNMFLASLIISFFIYHIYITDSGINSVNRNVDDLEVKIMKSLYNQEQIMKVMEAK